MHQAKSSEVGDALIENIITKYCIPEYIIMYQDNTFMSSLMTYLLRKFDIKIKKKHHTNINHLNLNMVLNLYQIS